MNKRRILHDVLRWFPDSCEQLAVLTDERSAAQLDRGDRARFHTFEVVTDYDGESTVHKAAALCRRVGADRILTTAEVDVMRAASLREELGLPGQRRESARAYRDKYVMKSIAAGAGIRTAVMALVEDRRSLEEFVRRNGLPVVLKVVAGKGSMGQGVLRSAAAVRKLGRQWDDRPPAEPLLAEAWLAGDEYHVDGLADRGRIVHCWPSRYLHPQWRTASAAASLVTGMLPAGDPLFARLTGAAEAVVAALPPVPAVHPFHAEFFVLPDGGIALVEIACRAGGGRIVPAYEASFGVNLYEAALKGQAGRATELREPVLRARHAYGCFPPRRGQLIRAPVRCALPGVLDFAVTARPGEYQGPRFSTHEIASVLVRLDESGLLDQLRGIERWWADAAGWRDVDESDVDYLPFRQPQPVAW